MNRHTAGRYYSFADTDFILSPEAAILRNLASSLYPDYLSRLYREGKVIHPHPIPALDQDFIHSVEARWFRVLSETIYTEIVLREQGVQHTVLLFGSARFGTRDWSTTLQNVPDYKEEARQLAMKVTEWSMTQGTKDNPQPFMICTGGGPGLMEAGNQGASDAGGRSISLNIFLPMEQDANPYVTPELNFDFHYFFTRKFHFLQRAKAGIVFPGGYGSMDELFETLTLIQTGKIEPFKLILYGEKFWRDVINLEKMVDYGTLVESDLNLFEYQSDVDAAVQSLIQALDPYL